MALLLACGYVAFTCDFNIAAWLSLKGEKEYYCRKRESNQLITASGPDAMRGDAG